MNRWIARVLFAAVICVSLSTTVQAQYKARPVITSLDPASGLPGCKVTIKGSNFGKEYEIYYNGIKLKPTSVSDTEIVVTLPKDAVQGRFTLKGPIHQVVSPQVFWVLQPKVAPVVTAISPNTGSPGTVVSITGKHFSAKSHENSVSIAGTPMQVRSATATRIEAIVPDNANSGNISVQVYNAGQATSTKKFTVLAKLKINSLDPPVGPPGTRVTIKGSGFSTKANQNTVTLSGKKLKVIKAHSNEVTVEIPRKGAVSGRFAIEVKGLGSTEYAKTFSVAYPPEIKSFSPESGDANSQVTIKGAHFGKDSSKAKIIIAGRTCSILAFSDDEIRVQVPKGAVTGPFELVVEGMGSAISKDAFEVWAPLAVTSMEPKEGLPGTEVKLFGTGFRSDPKDHKVLIGSAAVKVERIDSGALVFKIPEEAPDGTLSLRLEVNGRGATTVAIPLHVMHSPRIDGFSPSRGPAGTVVNITGNYFGTKTSHVRVMMGPIIVPARSVTPTMISLTIPPGAETDYFEVQTVRRGSAKSKSKFETYVPVMINNFLPSIGYAGQEVTIFGSGFEEAKNRNKVTVGGKKVQVAEASPTRLKVKLPKNVQSGKFKVEVPGRGSSETKGIFTVVEKLSVKSFTPKKGVQGAYVTIKGRGFENKGLRGYIGPTPMGVRVDSPTQVTIAVPPGATDGNFVFTAPGAGRAEATKIFKVMTPLTVTGFQPPAGPEGSKVYIYGTGFELGGKKTKVTFGTKRLGLEPGSNESMLVVTIPKGAMDSPFKVEVAEKGAIESENIFDVAAPAAAPAASAPVAQAPPATAPSAPVTAQPAKPAGAPVAAPTPAPTGPPPSMDELMGMKKSNVKITSLDPAEGAPGDVITVYGSGFGEDMEKVKAWVGKVPATVIGAVPDMIMIEIPVGVKRGKVRLKVADNPTVSSNGMLTVSE